jgi:hypothetical protein
MSFWKDVVNQVLGLTLGKAFGALKIRAAMLYVNVVKKTRLVALLACLLILSVVVLACGFLLIPIALCLFMPWAPEIKAIVAISFGAAYIIIPIIVVMSLLSQRRWMKMSHAASLLKEALK